MPLLTILVGCIMLWTRKTLGNKVVGSPAEAFCSYSQYVLSPILFWALLEKHSLIEAVISAIQFGTAFCLFIHWAAAKNDANNPSWPARMVP